MLTCTNCGKIMGALEQSHLTNEPDGSQTWVCNKHTPNERSTKTTVGSFTPGPWKVWPPEGTNITTDKSDAKTNTVARALTFVDARLIAAAPELLEALQTAYQFFNTEANTPDSEGRTVAPDSMVRVILRKMNEAITKAEGK